MSVNSSSPSNSSLSSPVYSYNSICGLITTAFNVTRTILVLPLSIFILYLGHQRWRQQRSSTTTSHSDIFTYHMAAMELIWFFGTALFTCGFFADLLEMMIASISLHYITNYAENFFHVLICVERYLAVVHPITYLGLRQARGVRIRNISIGCVWLQSFIYMAMPMFLQDTNLNTILFFCPLLVSLVIVCFCSMSVLCVLIRPGPGERGRDKQRGDQSKQKAFLTIMVILGALWLWFGGFLLSVTLDVSRLLSPSVSCVVKASVFWLNLPCSLVVPLLYLHRAGKLKSLCCDKSG